jgi:hypothetical protein
MTAGLAILGILVIIFVTPKPPRQEFHRDTQLSIQDVGRIIGDLELLKLGFGVFVLHLVLAATFVVFPLVLQQNLMVEESLHWRTYLPVFALSVLLLVPMVIVAEKMRKAQLVFRVAVMMLVLAEFGLAWSDSSRLERLIPGRFRDAGAVFRRLQFSRSDITGIGCPHRAGRDERHRDGAVFQRAVYRRLRGWFAGWSSARQG